jgi:hypothetical protein
VTTTPAPDTRTAPLPLWRSAGAFITTLFNLFGAPQDIAADHTLTAKTHALILAWLRVAEAFLRHLLLIEAAAYPATPSRASQRAYTTQVRKLVTFDPDKPEDWRVSFRCSSSPASSGGSAERQSRKAKGQVTRFHSAWPIAERFEALLRVYNNPAPYARRLARRLRALPRLIAAVLYKPTDFEHRLDEDTRVELNTHIDRAKPALDSG